MVSDTDRRRSAVDLPYLCAVLCAALAAVVGWTDLVLVVPGWVLPHWVVAGFLLLPAAAAVRVLFRRRPAPDRAGWQWAVLALSALAAVAGTAFGGLGDLWAEYRVLEPAGPDGCRAVVRETAFLMGGSGDLYAAKGMGLAFRSSSWMTDDGIRPVAAGQYELRWGPDDGALTLHGREGDPVQPALHEVDCR
ncbi:hypothetical protein AB0D45_05455 [Streptomyces sp. NPDC048352]|uniref:hypothetical protein n=1 Tax=Streptomyces sp. NPDC048352 TaxID=3154718 RepID=UPI003443DBCE